MVGIFTRARVCHDIIFTIVPNKPKTYPTTPNINILNNFCDLDKEFDKQGN